MGTLAILMDGRAYVCVSSLEIIDINFIFITKLHSAAMACSSRVIPLLHSALFRLVAKVLASERIIVRRKIDVRFTKNMIMFTKKTISIAVHRLRRISKATAQ